MRMIRTDEWKLIRHYDGGQADELYHLSADAGESKNLYDSAPHKEVRDKLQARLTEWMKSIGDPLVK
jgi:uncharacterized sulfatase